MSNSDKITKIFKAEIKEVDKEKSTVTAKISDQTLDRHGDIILISAWAKGLSDFKKHPVLLSSHSYGKLQSQIGKVDKVWIDEKEKALMAKMTYFTNAGNAEADWGFKLAEMGQAAYSVGFMAKKSVASWNTDEDEMKEILRQNGIKLKKDQRLNRVFMEVGLLENSHVTVPANPSALQKSLDEEENPVLIEIMSELKEINEDLSAYDVNKDAGDSEEDALVEVISEMVNLLSDSDIADSEKEEKYNGLKEQYESFEIEAPELRTYEKVEDVIEGCKDITTASLILDKIYAEKTAKIFRDLLENLGIESELESKIKDIVNSVSEKCTEMVDDIHSRIKNDIEVSTDVIVNSIDNLDTKSIEKKDKKEDKTSNYIEEILNINTSLKKASV